MSHLRANAILFLVSLGACVALAVFGLVWLGADGRVPVDIAPDGTVTKSAPVQVLWFMPGILAIVYGVFMLCWWASARQRRAAAPLGQDTARAFDRYHRTFRNYALGFGVLSVLLQVFTLVRAAGVAQPLGLDRESMVRLLFGAAGLLFVYVGNIGPKLPYIPNRGIDAARHYRINRFFGWVFVIGGVAYAVMALFAPFDRLSQYGGAIVATMIALPILRAAWAIADQWRRKRRGASA